MTIRAILTDIEGTTSSIAFVHEILFPYASKALPEFVRKNQHDAAIAEILAEVRAQAGTTEADVEATIGVLLGWIQEDRKVTALKALQGHIWKNGYEVGDFSGHVYPDAATNLRQWANDGIALYVYSSGSTDAQKLLFGHSEAGDLRPLFKGYFDTRIGMKREADSYASIARNLKISAGDILFLSDIAEELDAAAAVGMKTMQLIRDDDVIPGSHEIARNFDEVTRHLVLDQGAK